MEQKFFLTTPIYYVNEKPHLGHLYTTLAADVLARFERNQKKEVFFLTGTDEHGAKVEAAAKEAGVSAKNFVDKISAEFKKAWRQFKIEPDFFGRTTDPSHIKKVEDFLILLKKKNFLYPGKYQGLYCRQCEEFKRPKDIKRGNCPIHKIKVEEVKEPVWFFKLSSFQDKLVELIKSDSLLVEPPARKQEILSFLKEPLQDVAISRSKVSWGIPLPWDKSQTVYVWVDALLNYLTFAPRRDKDGLPPEAFGEGWPADFHLIGKDILRFHTVIWPALLLAAKLSLPKKIFVHGFFTIAGEKMSKTRRNVIAPDELAQKFGVEASRYLILAAFPFGRDGDFSWERLSSLYKAQLQNGLGNLLQRTITLLSKAKIKPSLAKDRIACAKADRFLEKLDFYRSLKAINSIVEETNRFIDHTQPWQLLKDSSKRQKLEQILTNLTHRLETISAGLAPYMPQTSKEILNQLKTQKPRPLFPPLKEGKVQRGKGKAEQKNLKT